MFSISLKARAKINFCLDIIGVRADGYHLIESVMQSIEIHDTVKVKKLKENKISVRCSDKSINETDNIAYKAAKCFFESTGISGGAQIKVIKRIPSQAGLGGGSADGAAVLVALNRLFKAGLNKEALCKIGEKVGADVPFCIVGGTQLVRGIGEQLTALDDCPKCHLVIAKGNECVSTKEAYSRFDTAENVPPVYLNKVIEALSAGNFEALKGKLINVFEKTSQIPEVEHIIASLKDFGAIDAAMTGSGSAVFSIFNSKKSARKAAKALTQKGFYAKLTSVSPLGISLF